MQKEHFNRVISGIFRELREIRYIHKARKGYYRKGSFWELKVW